MQKYCTELTERLLKSLDKEYNVVDMGAVVDVITALEKTTITKEVLEFTRLGKYINELRRKTSNDVLAKRAKDLVRRWREMLLPSAHSTPQPTPADPAPPALNGAKPHSPSLKGLKPQSPALRGLKPQSPLSRDATHLRVLSPALSVHSDRSHSPRNTTPNKQTSTATSNHRLSPGESPKPGHTTQNHSTEAVPRTHSSNKRLRKEDLENARCGTIQGEPFAKRQRLNGENVNSTPTIGLNSQVPSPASRDDKPPQSLAELPQVAPDLPDGPKKRGRKKGSKSVKKQPHVEDRVKEKLASISRNPKLKTTQELLADLQARGTNSGLTSTATPSQNKKEPPSAEDVLRSSNEHVAKYLQSQSDVLRNVVVDNNRAKINDNGHKTSSKYRDHLGSGEVVQESKSRESPPISSRELSVEEILAKLPPLDLATIVWSDHEEEQDEEQEGDDVAERPPREVLPQDLERLHEELVEGLNGNYQPRLSDTTTMETTTSKDGNQELISRSWCSDNINGGQTDREFREWHQMLARPSFDSQTLHILPYVIID